MKLFFNFFPYFPTIDKITGTFAIALQWFSTLCQVFDKTLCGIPYLSYGNSVKFLTLLTYIPGIQYYKYGNKAQMLFLPFLLHYFGFLGSICATTMIAGTLHSFKIHLK